MKGGCQNRGGSAVPMIEETTMNPKETIMNRYLKADAHVIAEALCVAKNATDAALELIYREVAIEGQPPSDGARLNFARAVYATQAVLDSLGVLPAAEILALARDLSRPTPVPVPGGILSRKIAQKALADGPGITPLGQVPDRGYDGKPREVKPG